VAGRQTDEPGRRMDGRTDNTDQYRGRRERERQRERDRERERERERDTEDGQINEKETEGIGWNGF
jgi:hypothetical protein